jgi:hypothetical protein
LLRGILWRAELVLLEVKLVLFARVVGYGRNFPKDVLQSLDIEPFIGLNLTLDQVRDIEDLWYTGICPDIRQL